MDTNRKRIEYKKKPLTMPLFFFFLYSTLCWFVHLASCSIILGSFSHQIASILFLGFLPFVSTLSLIAGIIFIISFCPEIYRIGTGVHIQDGKVIRNNASTNYDTSQKTITPMVPLRSNIFSSLSC